MLSQHYKQHYNKDLLMKNQDQSMTKSPTKHKRSMTATNITGFSEKELKLLRKRFDKMAVKGVLTKDSFRESLGLLGLEHATFLSERLFNIVDSSGDGYVDFNEFMQYLAVVLNGSDYDKAQMSFRFLDLNKKGKITYGDFQKMILDLSIFWNMVTGSKSKHNSYNNKVIPQQEYIEQIWNQFDIQGGELQFDSYFKQYEYLSDIFDWFEFFNQDDGTKRRLTELAKQQQQLKKQQQGRSQQMMVMNTLDILDNSIPDFLLNLREYEKEKSRVNSSKFTQSNYSSNPQLSSKQKLFSQLSHQQQFQGPCYFHVSTASKSGDIDPIDEEALDVKAHSRQSSYFDQLKQDLLSKSQISKSQSQDYLDIMESQIKDLHTLLENTLDYRSFEPEEEMSPQIKKKVDDMKQSFGDRQMNRAFSLRRRQTMRQLPQKDKSGEVKRNISVYFGHENWNLILNMMIGMRKSIKQIQTFFINGVTPQDFTTKMVHDILPQRTQNFDYRKVYHFIDYRPYVFYNIRMMYGITNQDYQKSIGPENMLGNLVLGKLNSLTELGSSGKSGSFFYFTQDSKYMIKTISVLEAKFFKRILQNYYFHLQRNENTLISRIFGFHKMKIFRSKTDVQKVYLVVLANLFSAGLDIDYRYDIKGSLYDRRTRKPNTTVDPGIALKDLDMIDDKNYLKLEPKERRILEEQIKLDCMFLRENQIIDYSLLIGTHLRSQDRYMQYGQFKVNPSYLRFNEKFEGGILSRDQRIIYYFGIIDILTEFNTRKQWEHGIKVTFVSSDVSCIPPIPYSRRFENFVQKYVLEPQQLGQF